MRVYVPVQVNKFVTNYVQIELCDCVDEVFYTDEEIREIRNCNHGITRHLKRELIDPILQSILQKYNEKPQNKKTIVVKEIEQLTCCKDDDYYHLIEDELRDFLNEHKIQRVGTRLSPKIDKSQQNKLITDHQLVTIVRALFDEYCRQNYSFNIRITNVQSNRTRSDFMKLLKVKFTIEQLSQIEKDEHTYDYYQIKIKEYNDLIVDNPKNFERFKQVYENPELLNPTVV